MIASWIREAFDKGQRLKTSDGDSVRLISLQGTTDRPVVGVVTHSVERYWQPPLDSEAVAYWAGDGSGNPSLVKPRRKVKGWVAYRGFSAGNNKEHVGFSSHPFKSRADAERWAREWGDGTDIREVEFYIDPPEGGI